LLSTAFCFGLAFQVLASSGTTSSVTPSSWTMVLTWTPRRLAAFLICWTIVAVEHE
jgi:hypothetical protein